ncbi:MAG: hypothetical protein K9M49_06840, partial [Candidatus Marinimicrobia bacterium]|nr:hypothetical protein [Candidatus Neomarinimicrobiota bacterium]
NRKKYHECVMGVERKSNLARNTYDRYRGAFYNIFYRHNRALKLLAPLPLANIFSIDGMN